MKLRTAHKRRNRKLKRIAQLKVKNPCVSCGLCCISYPTNAKRNGHPQEWARILDSEVNNVPRTLYRITRDVKLAVHKDSAINKFIKDKPDKIWKGYR